MRIVLRVARPPMKSPTEVTLLLSRMRAGDAVAGEELMPEIYGVLRQIAVGALNRFDRRSSLQPTALVNEAFLKVFGALDQSFDDRSHFLSVAAIAMRQVLVDHARRRNSKKRGEGASSMPLDEVLLSFEETSTNVLDLHDALERFTTISPQGARVVEMRFFGGLTNDEIAKVLGTSTRTVEREWRAARAWLYASLVGPNGSAEPRN